MVLKPDFFYAGNTHRGPQPEPGPFRRTTLKGANTNKPWAIITVDHLYDRTTGDQEFDEIEQDETDTSVVGHILCGTPPTDPTKGEKFYLFDDDGGLYFEGYLGEGDGSDPDEEDIWFDVYRWGMAFSGTAHICTTRSWG